MEFFQQHYIVIIGCLFLCVLTFMTWLTYKEKKWIKENYKKEEIIALGFGVTCFGVASDKGATKHHKGFLLIHRGGLFFKSRFSSILFDIPGESIQKVYHGDSPEGGALYRSAVKVDFLISSKTTDTIAFKLAYPPQWIKIIGKTFIKNSL